MPHIMLLPLKNINYVFQLTNQHNHSDWPTSSILCKAHVNEKTAVEREESTGLRMEGMVGDVFYNSSEHK